MVLQNLYESLALKKMVFSGFLRAVAFKYIEMMNRL